MRRVILLVILTVPSANATAGWVLIEGNEKQTAYFDPASIHKIEKDDRAIMWSMIDLKEASKLSDGKQFLSWTTQYEFGCKERQSRILAASMHSGNMGSGEITNTLDFDSPQWEAILPDSRGEILWKLACEKQ